MNKKINQTFACINPEEEEEEEKKNVKALQIICYHYFNLQPIATIQ